MATHLKFHRSLKKGPTAIAMIQTWPFPAIPEVGGGGGMMEPWAEELADGNVDLAWDLFLGCHAASIHRAIRRRSDDDDDIGEKFSYVIERLHRNGLGTLSKFEWEKAGGAAFATWLVNVVRNMAIDWRRSHEGRVRDALPRGLTVIGQLIHERVFMEGYSHAAAYQMILSISCTELTHHEFQAELRRVYRVALARFDFQRRHGLSHADRTCDEVEGLPSGEGTPAMEGSSVLSELIGALAPEDRELIQLCWVDGLSAKEVARRLEWRNEKKVYNRSTRLRTWLRKELESRGIGREEL